MPGTNGTAESKRAERKKRAITARQKYTRCRSAARKIKSRAKRRRANHRCAVAYRKATAKKKHAAKKHKRR